MSKLEEKEESMMEKIQIYQKYGTEWEARGTRRRWKRLDSLSRCHSTDAFYSA